MAGPPHTRTLRGAGSRVTIKRFRLQVLEGPDQGRSVLSAGARLGIGTEAGNDLVLGDATVSRFHCEITLSGGRATVRDLGSRNGTVIDGVSVEVAELRGGMTLTLGSTRVRFELGGERVEVALAERERFGLLVGASAAMRGCFALLEHAAAGDLTVLIEGETGTGKEAAAESIHLESARRAGPLVVVDCGAVAPEQLDSELFGHVRGAFPGALRARAGAFEAASGGTLLLDDVGDLPLDVQPRLLRALEKREVKRVGGDKYVAVDARVIAATARNLREDVNQKQFRPDLYFRLAVLTVRMPPLRERPHDLPMLVEHLLADAGVTGARAAALGQNEFLAELARHRWPGNVRELRNYLERCLAAGHALPVTSAADSAAGAPEVDATQPLRAQRERWLSALEGRYLRALLQRHGDNVSAAAKAAGLGRLQMYRLLWRHGLR